MQKNDVQGPRLRILHAAAELIPFVKTGGLADVVDALTNALARNGHDVRVAIPRYLLISDSAFPSVAVGSFTIELLGNMHAGSIHRYSYGRDVDVYFVDIPSLLARSNVYGEPDDALRFIAFSKAVLELPRLLQWMPDVIHCHDWHSALIPVFLKNLYTSQYQKTSTVLTVHNLGYQGLFSKDCFDAMGLDASLFNHEQLEFYGRVNFLKGGVVFSDFVTTVSEKYAEEILNTNEYSYGLEGVFRQKEAQFVGILNGFDGRQWNPETDPFLEAQYSRADPSGKAKNKVALQQELKLEFTGTRRLPLIGMISRLDVQKGFDLLLSVLEKLPNLGQFVLLGVGDKEIESHIARIAEGYPGAIAARFGFNDRLAHRIFGGADFFLMPSKYEPCGLNQMYSIQYGTIPIVRHTGGLADTVQEFDPETGQGNGFSFEEYDAVPLLAALDRAVKTYRTPHLWKKVMQNAMTSANNFGWDASAARYEEVYRRAIALRIAYA